MLPAQARMRSRTEFTATVRNGRRAHCPLVTGYLLVGTRDGEPPRVGLIVSRAVGGAVARNRVKRRLRALLRGYVPRLPRGSLLVVRAAPAASTARHADVAAGLDLVLARLMGRGGGRPHDNRRAPRHQGRHGLPST